jgi:cytoskeletal protein RodZ
VFEIGNSLREARERQGLDFHQAELAIKIRSRYLQALEDETFDAVPGQTYVKGFLRAYADFLGLDGQIYVDEYTSRFFVDDETRHRARRVRPRKQPHLRAERNVVLVTLVGVAVVTALIIAAWRFGGGGSNQSIPNLAQKTKPSAPAVKHRRPTGATLVVRAAKGRSSLLSVRLGSAAGKPLYQGTLEPGQSQRFRARRLWLNVGSPESLTMTLNGRLIRIGGSCPRVLVISAHEMSSTSRCG